MPADALRATYRLQLHAGFGFEAATRVVDYLDELGVSHAYLSPCLTAVKGSMHGYDVADPTKENAELGGEAGHAALTSALKARGMGQIIDVVPNHMAASPEENPWWRDVLEHGKGSHFGAYFDIDWDHGDGRVVLPVLGDDEPVQRTEAYERVPWRAGASRRNYRRFFDVDSLIGLNVHLPHVFDDSHAVIARWLRDGIVDGVRVDHVDGLQDPAGYLAKLAAFAPSARIFVEKILGPGESLPATWPVAGTTGYDFLNRLEGLFVDPAGEEPLIRFYRRFTGETRSFSEVADDAKRLVMRESLASDVSRLVRLLRRECDSSETTDDELRAVITEYLARLPVYRTYLAPASEFTLVLQQTSGAVMAKGVEDTAFYRYVPLLSLNEVGSDPSKFGGSLATFHDECRRAALERPEAMLTTATHDTKRGEDTRARLDVLSEIPEAWAQAVLAWSEKTARYRAASVSRNDEYVFYQVLVGAHPLGEERAVEYMRKSMREAKRQTSWTDPDEAYENAVLGFVKSALADEAFVSDVRAFVQRIMDPAYVVSLSKKLIALTAPGVPDVYQGTELWDYSLVDPDNRRPVDFDARRRLLARVERETPEESWDARETGAPKLRVVHAALQVRRRFPACFGPSSTYEPLNATDHVIAYARGDSVVVVAPRFPTKPVEGTTAELPAGHFVNALTGDAVEGGRVRVATLLRRFPVALLTRTA